MDFTWTPRAEALARRGGRAFLDAQPAPRSSTTDLYGTGESHHDDDFARALGRAGLDRPGLGARTGSAADLDAFDVHVLDDELTKAESPDLRRWRPRTMVARVIERSAPTSSRRRSCPAAMRGEVTIALGHERARGRLRRRRRADPGPARRRRVGDRRPEDVHHQRPPRRLRVPAGPDRTRTCRTTRASPSSWCRSIIPGVEVQAVLHALGRADQHHLLQRRPAVDDRWRIGEVDDGLALADAGAAGRALARRSAPTSPGSSRRPRRGRRHPDVAGEVAPSTDRRPGAPRPGGRPSSRWPSCSSSGSTWMEVNGQVPVAEGPMAKLFSTEALVRQAEHLTELVGPDALREPARPDGAAAAAASSTPCASRSARPSTPAPARSSATSSPSAVRAASVVKGDHPLREGLNLLDGSWYADDPHEVWAWMRREAPVYYDEVADVWGITRYDDVLAIEKDPTTFSSRRAPRPHGDPLPMMISMDDPEHQRRRSLVNRGFTPRRIGADGGDGRPPSARRSSTRCASAGSCDFVWDVAAPLPLLVIADLLGFEPEHHDDLLRWSDDMLRATTLDPAPRWHERGPGGDARLPGAPARRHRRAPGRRPGTT